MKDEDVQRVLDYCNGCLRFNAAKRRCRAFTDPFPLWKGDERARHNNKCFSRQESAVKYRDELLQMKNYDVANGGRNDSKVHGEIKWIETQIDKEVQSLAHESDRTGFPWIYKMGGSDNSDGSQFGKESMKDNRMMHRKRDPKREDWN